MKNLFTTLSAVAFLLFVFTPATSSAQGLIDGYFQGKGDVSLTAGYTRGAGDAFYVADERVEGIPMHGKITQDVFSLYGTYGILDDLTFVASVPYIRAQSEGDASVINTEIDGLQDVQLALKYRFGRAPSGASNLDFFGAVGVTLPGNYEPNGILSLGSGAFATDLTLGAQYNSQSGFFGSLVAGYSLRGEADNNADDASADFDVPNAVLGTFKLGYAGSKIYGEAFFDIQHSTDGVDIMGEGFMGNFPETRVNYARLGASVYYPITSSLGVSVGYSTFVDGRNVTDNDYISGGVTVSF